MPDIHVQKSILINAPIEKIYQSVLDFNHWMAWSPWLIMEPEATVVISDDAKYYEWQGKRLGSGNMSVTDARENDFVDYDLIFLTPWKSTSKVRFELKSRENGTETIWYMDSKLPFYLFWMKKMMEAYIAIDLQRGLALLKDYVEDGEVHSKLTFIGESPYPGCTYVGIHTECSMGQLSSRMKEDFTTLWNYLSQDQKNLEGHSFSMYHKWDMVKGKVAYTSGFPVKALPGDLPDVMLSGAIPELKVYALLHTGPYIHLGNAWSTLYNMQRNKTFKMDKKADPFEVYVNMPGQVPDNELITEINFPIK